MKKMSKLGDHSQGARQNKVLRLIVLKVFSPVADSPVQTSKHPCFTIFLNAIIFYLIGLKAKTNFLF